jgi:hypothetical protein
VCGLEQLSELRRVVQMGTSFDHGHRMPALRVS